jgi:hypothetical protein
MKSLVRFHTARLRRFWDQRIENTNINKAMESRFIKSLSEAK